MLYDILYKQDSTGRLRSWQMEREGSKYRTISGLVDGNPVTSGWTQATAASQDTDEAQAIFEVEAKYRHQLDREYHETIDTVGIPNFFEPMLAKGYSTFPGKCWSQAKFDGLRCIARAEGLFTRQGQPINSMPHVIEVLAPLFQQDPDLVLDGEAYAHSLKDDFGAIMSIARKKNPTPAQIEIARTSIQMHVYDLPSHRAGFGARFELLSKLIDPNQPGIELAATDLVRDEAHLDELWRRATKGRWSVSTAITSRSAPNSFSSGRSSSPMNSSASQLRKATATGQGWQRA
jgi:DNA ligase-1